MTGVEPYPDYKESGVKWLGKIPSGWETCALGRFVRFRNGADSSAVEIDTGGYPVYGSGGEFRRASSFLYDGESVLFGRKGTVDRPLHVRGRFWTVDTMYYTEIVTSRFVPRFIYYCATQLPYSYWLTNTALPSITQSDLRTAKIPYISTAEQEEIVSFLDRETAEIDAFIADQEDLIRLLVERRKSTQAAVLSRATTERAVRLRFLFEQSREDGSIESEVLSVYRDYGVIPKSSRADNFNKTPEDVSRYLVVRPGYLVVNKMKAWQGSLGVSTYDGIVSPDYEVLRPASTLLGPRFAHAYLRSPQMIGEYAVRSVGIRPSQWRLHWEQLRDIAIPLPSLSKQVDICDTLDRETAELEAAVADAREAIALSRERRAALISAAVTGKIDLRRAA